MDAVRIQARFIVVSPTRILHPGQIVVRHGRVVAVTDAVTEPADIDLQDAALLPGFVNVHTHLEFSDLRQPFAAGAAFPEWIGSVVQYRREKLADQEAASHRARTLARGLAECFHSGTALVGEIATPPWDAQRIQPEMDLSAPSQADARLPEADWNDHFRCLASPKVCLFPEVLGLDLQRFEQSVAWAEEVRAEFQAHATPLLHACGISPHAPYSVLFPEVVERLKTTRPADRPMAMHVAESLAEREWAEQGSGPFRDAFERLDVALPTRRMQVIDAVRWLTQQATGLLIHGNYLNRDEFDLLANSNVSVVYCPRTHAHFGHSEYPLGDLQRRQLRLVLATDSRASNPDLQLWSEVVTARRRHHGLSAVDALAAVTSQAAEALNCQQAFGSLDVGRWAYANVVHGPTHLPAAAWLEAITTSTVGELALQPLATAIQLDR